MNTLLTTYAVIITTFSIMLVFNYQKLLQRYIDEQNHSSDLRGTILEYLTKKSEGMK